MRVPRKLANGQSKNQIFFTFIHIHYFRVSNRRILYDLLPKHFWVFNRFVVVVYDGQRNQFRQS